METLKVKIKKVVTPAMPEVTEELPVEIQLPFFSKIHDTYIYYQIRPDTSVVRVINYSDNTGESEITYHKNSLGTQQNAINGNIISREEFYEQYNKAMARIQEPIPTREEVEQI